MKISLSVSCRLVHGGSNAGRNDNPSVPSYSRKHDLGPQIMQIVNAKINAAGLHLVKGRIVDASFIEAPTSTKIRPEPVILR